MKSILVVEDEPAIATGLKDDLELDGFHVDVAEDGHCISPLLKNRM